MPDTIDHEQLFGTVNRLEREMVRLRNAVELRDAPLVSVVMTTYNVGKFIEQAITSVINQSYPRLELIIVDDASNDNTIELIQQFNNPRIHLYQNKINCGTYYSKNIAISSARGKYIAIQDADDVSHEFRLEKQVRQLEENESLVYSLCQYTRFDEIGNQLIPPRLGFQSSLIRRSVFDQIGYYDSVRVAADDEFDSRMRLFYGPQSRGVVPELLYFNRQREDSLTAQIKIGSEARTSYVEEYRAWHKSLESEKTKCYTGFPLKQRHFLVKDEICVPYRAEIEPTNNNTRISLPGEMRTASLATIPSRAHLLREVIASILPQVERLNVYLNGFENVPTFLNQEKIRVAKSEDNGNLADGGKFFWAHETRGYHFTIDDDIVYPDDYTDHLIDKLAEFDFDVAIGTHGILINEPFFSYYDVTSRTVYRFLEELLQDKYVHIIGTGTLCYHTSSLNFDLANIKKERMVDIYFGLNAQKNHVPMICVAHAENWLKELETPLETRIYAQFKGDDTVQSELVKSEDWQLNFVALDAKENVDAKTDNETHDHILKRLNTWGKQIIEQQKTILALESRLAEKEKEIIWYQGHIEDFKKHSIEYRLKRSRLFPRWLLKIGKEIKTGLLSLLSKPESEEEPESNS